MQLGGGWWWIGPVAGGLLIALNTAWGLSLRIEANTASLLEQAAQIADTKERLAVIKDLSQYQLDNQIKIWTSLVQFVGVVVLAAGGYFTWRNLRATQAKLDIDRESQITNRFTQAVAQLGAELKEGQPNLEVRLGGIYALERIARDSPRDHWTIMEVLTAYVRENAPWPPAAEGQKLGDEPRSASQVRRKPRVDIQAVLTVIGRRPLHRDLTEPASLDLAETDLRGANLAGSQLRRAVLVGTQLDGADLSEADLQGAGLRGAHLTRADLTRAWLRGASLAHARLAQARLPRATLWDANLEAALLFEADLQRVDFEDANLSRAYIDNARLELADLSGAKMDGASLDGAYLDGADLRSARGLTTEQIQSAHRMGEGAILPPALTAGNSPQPDTPAIDEQAGPADGSDSAPNP